MTTQNSPRSVGALPEARSKSTGANLTTATKEAQGLRFVLDGLVHRKHRLAASQSAREEMLVILRRLRDPGVAILLARQEKGLKSTQGRLDDVRLAVMAVESALSRLEGGAA